MKWSASIVLTPRGWVGRIDNYVSGKTLHVEVDPPFKALYKKVEEIQKEEREKHPEEFIVDEMTDEEWELIYGPLDEEEETVFDRERDWYQGFYAQY